MAKYVVALCLMATVLVAGPYGKADVDVAKWAEPAIQTCLPHGAPQISRGMVYEDSSMNQYGVWTSMQDCIKGLGGKAVVLMREYGDGTLGSGAGGLAWTIDNGTSWTVDWPMNDGLLNDPHPGVYYMRYPTAGYHTDFPYGSWPELLPGGSGWGYATVGNEIDWETPGFYGVFSDNIDVHKNWSWERNDGMIVGAAQDEGDNNFTWVYDPMMGDFDTAPTAQPQLAGFSTYGFDERDGSWLAIGYHSTLGGAAYATSDNGYDNWSTPVLLSPPGMPSGWTVYWMDGAFAPDGTTPMEVLDLDESGTLAQANEVWFFRPDTAVRVDAGMDTYNHYCQFAIQGDGTIWVWWCEATNVDEDPEIEGWWHDIYYSTSTDGGYSWNTPVNITNTSDVNETMMHVARYNNYLLYCTTLDETQGDIYYGVLAVTGYDAYETRMFVDNNYAFGVAEDQNPTRPTELGLSVIHQLFEHNLNVEFTIPTPGVTDISVYNETGRSVLRHSGSYTEGTHMETFNTSQMPAGTYFLKLDFANLSRTAKFVVLR